MTAAREALLIGVARVAFRLGRGLRLGTAMILLALHPACATRHLAFRNP